ncbi:hypothetical protein [Spiroplasma endosymbiont of Othius punctulatus]|uniref:hypothetical protein n=1 Tax=Spiroplasma endosymbiont of Othius punctulatus TaxID=3066289 RepID=UPI0030CF8F9A
MEPKLKAINAQRIKITIVCLIIQTLVTMSLLITAISISVGGASTESIVTTWFFALYFLYANIWLGFVLAYDLANKINKNNEMKLLFSGIGSIISIFSLIVWVVYIREMYFEKKYSIDLLEEPKQKQTDDEENSSEGE